MLKRMLVAGLFAVSGAAVAGEPELSLGQTQAVAQTCLNQAGEQAKGLIYWQALATAAQAEVQKLKAELAAAKPKESNK